MAPTDVSIGIHTSVTGGPFFVFLMRSSRHGLTETPS